MLNSMNYQSDKEVINVGETIASETDFKDPNVTIYYHQTKGAQTHMPDGAAIVFVGGQFATSNPEIKAYLDKIANKPGTQVYTKKEVARQNLKELANLAEEARVPAGNALEAVGKAVADADTIKQTEQGMQATTVAPSAEEQALAAAELKKDGITVPQVPVRR